ncbi:catalase family peroxidase [Variovorax sp. YR216]|uniref:catalase family peroxidase n=1 Tax=Variovorax sp. YR216 TaxID=1882828 RepID=UPI00089A8C75|nr:catalase family peroxidase [Variovorax sp. YR216]SEB25996.1 catalase [Variovorax sp. YR216]
MGSSTIHDDPPAGERGVATPASIVDALKAVAGNPRAARASFAKGVCVRGTYTPSAEAGQVTRSLNFTRSARVVARFSVGGGNPSVADTNKAVLRGFSFRLEGDGTSTDILTENAPVHFAKSLEQMLGFLNARVPRADGTPDPEKVKAFSAANPETLNQANFVAARPLPGSFAGTNYWGVHSFPATNAAGQTRFIKFKVIPADAEVTLTDDEAKQKPADFLPLDLESRITEGRAAFHVMALLDRPGDPTMDVTVRWPDEDTREAIRLGTIEITAVEPSESCDAIFFNPANLAEGISHPPDEIFAARETTYRISLARRRREQAAG